MGGRPRRISPSVAHAPTLARALVAELTPRSQPIPRRSIEVALADKGTFTTDLTTELSDSGEDVTVADVGAVSKTSEVVIESTVKAAEVSDLAAAIAELETALQDLTAEDVQAELSLTATPTNTITITSNYEPPVLPPPASPSPPPPSTPMTLTSPSPSPPPPTVEDDDSDEEEEDDDSIDEDEESVEADDSDGTTIGLAVGIPVAVIVLIGLAFVAYKQSAGKSSSPTEKKTPAISSSTSGSQSV